MDKNKPEDDSKRVKYSLLAPIFRLARMFEGPTTAITASTKAEDDKTALKEVHKNYLEYRNKSEAVQTASRMELDKTILSISMQGMIFTFAIVNGLKPEHYCQIQFAWIFWTLAIVLTILSMLISEYSAEKYVAILDDSYDIAEEKTLAKLPVDEALKKRTRFIQLFIKSNSGLMNFLNYSGPIFFTAAVISAVWWMFLLRGI